MCLRGDHKHHATAGRRFPAGQLDLDKLGPMIEQTVFTHIITSRHLVPMMIAADRGLIVEVMDGRHQGYRGQLLYDLAKASVVRLQSGPLRLATCNLHGLQTKQGVTALVKEVRLRQYITSNFPLSRADTDERRHHADVWIESGSVSLGPVFIEGLARLVREALAGDRDLRSQDGGRLCPARWGRCPNFDT